MLILGIAKLREEFLDLLDGKELAIETVVTHQLDDRENDAPRKVNNKVDPRGVLAKWLHQGRGDDWKAAGQLW